MMESIFTGIVATSAAAVIVSVIWLGIEALVALFKED